MVFAPTAGPVDLRDLTQWWFWTPGAHWRHPEGAGSNLDGRARHPVVHVAAEDAEAYARWAGKRLASEAEWERAARGGLEGAEFVWGDRQLLGGRPPANWWQGEFPWQNTLDDGYERTAPVGSFPANGYGLFDMAGNVWEWTGDWYADRSLSSCCAPPAPRLASEEESYDRSQASIRIPRRVVKGGSFLCADNYCRRYRPAARQAQMVDSGTSHIGFRCAADAL
jgi:formylglycine-generating enzyme required for sulfatase activity